MLASLVPGGIRAVGRTLTSLLHGGLLFVTATPGRRTMLVIHYPFGRRGQPATQVGAGYRAGSASQHQKDGLDGLGNVR
jgi:hypothetical protein